MCDGQAEAPRRSPLATLVRLELRRSLPQLRSGAILASVGTALVLLSGTERRDLLAFPSGVVGLSLTMTVGMNGLRDRMDHGLELIQSLPVAAGLAAAARMIACGVLCGVGAVLTTTSLSLVLPDVLGGFPTPAWFVLTAFGTWAGLFLMGSLLCGALLRYSQARLRTVPPLFAVALVTLASLPEAWLPDQREVIAMTLQPWFPAVAQVAVWALASAAAWAAHRMLTAAIRDFIPARDKIEW